MNELGEFFGDMFKNFPKFTIFFIFMMIYGLWYSTGGVERGEARRASGQDGLFIQVRGVPDQFEQDEFFGAVPEKDIDNIEKENTDQE